MARSITRSAIVGTYTCTVAKKQPNEPSQPSGEAKRGALQSCAVPRGASRVCAVPVKRHAGLSGERRMGKRDQSGDFGGAARQLLLTQVLGAFSSRYAMR